MQTGREALARPAALVAGSGLLLVAALFLGGGSRDDRLALIGTAAVVAAVLATGLALVGRLPVPVPGRWAPAFLALLFGIVLWSGLTVWWSIGPDLSWRYANRGIAYMAFCVLGLLVAASIPRAPRIVAAGLALLVAAVIGWALAGKIAPAFYPDSFRFARLRDPIGYWNALALVAGTGLPLALWIAASRAHAHLVRAAGTLLLFATTVTLLLTFSRGGVAVAAVGVAVWLVLTERRLEGVGALVIAVPPALALSAWAFSRPGLADDGVPHSVRFDDGIRFGFGLALLGALVFGVSLLASRYEARRPPTPELAHRVLRWAALGTAVAVVAAGLVFVVAADPVGWLDDQVDEFTNPTTQPVPQGPERLRGIGSNNRWGWWTEAWEAFRDDPLGGTGAGTFQLVHLKLRDNENFVTEPHDLPLQALSETGLIGFALAVGAGFAGLLAVRRSLRRLTGEERAAALALAVGALLYPLHGLVDYDWDFVAVSAPFLFTVGVLLAVGAPVRRVRHPFAMLAVVLVGLAAVASLLTPWYAERRVRSAEAAIRAGDPARGVELADEARDLNPLSVEPLFTGAAAAERQGNPREALRLYIRATELQPENWETWYQLGVFELAGESYGWAELHLARAKGLNPFSRPVEQALEAAHGRRQ